MVSSRCLEAGCAADGRGRMVTAIAVLVGAMLGMLFRVVHAAPPRQVVGQQQHPGPRASPARTAAPTGRPPLAALGEPPPRAAEGQQQRPGQPPPHAVFDAETGRDYLRPGLGPAEFLLGNELRREPETQHIADCLERECGEPVCGDYAANGTHRALVRGVTRRVGQLRPLTAARDWGRFRDLAAGYGTWHNELLWNTFPFLRRPGAVVLEMGALDGIDGAHSVFWEHVGSRVLLVEADAHYAKRIKKHRPNATVGHFASGCREGQKDVEFFSLRGGGNLADSACQTAVCAAARQHARSGFRVRCGNLTQWLYDQQAASLDLLLLDVEGVELTVLAELLVPVRVAVVELCSFARTADCMAARRLLISRGMRYLQRVRGDDVWYLPSAAALDPAAPGSAALHERQRDAAHRCFALPVAPSRPAAAPQDRQP
eukprot:TRINITY_DN37277_c0_g1_i1.p1 TRINITY_DN37277_c0_g1~~TRINITY_DN37277_c0_g1_i1.p1  ORF type:complete len:430 (+),score=118.11 TRINITY_DN37277_c0_g1_i1:75-1364(+)